MTGFKHYDTFETWVRVEFDKRGTRRQGAMSRLKYIRACLDVPAEFRSKRDAVFGGRARAHPRLSASDAQLPPAVREPTSPHAPCAPASPASPASPSPASSPGMLTGHRASCPPGDTPPSQPSVPASLSLHATLRAPSAPTGEDAPESAPPASARRRGGRRGGRRRRTRSGADEDGRGADGRLNSAKPAKLDPIDECLPAQ
mmetsp:Transcript_9745/g.26480  ORF Transcript_9745/g.26480 Transcript_9745/m.26480 type:complete len:201 (+) Transcript_9745:228-830(+)